MTILRHWFPRLTKTGIVLVGSDLDDHMKLTSPIVTLQGDVAVTRSGSEYWLVGPSRYALDKYDFGQHAYTEMLGQLTEVHRENVR